MMMMIIGHKQAMGIFASSMGTKLERRRVSIKNDNSFIRSTGLAMATLSVVSNQLKS